MVSASLMGKVQRLLSANLYSVLIGFKFAGLMVMGFVFPDLPDYFGQYALAIGLVSIFFLFSGMRGRLYVFSGILSKADFRHFLLAMLTLGAVSWSVSLLVFGGHEYFGIIALVGLGKFFEMFLDANTSFMQVTQDRERSFKVLNQHSVMVLFGFFAGLPFGLEIALVFECCVLVFTIIRQLILLRGAPEVPEPVEQGWFPVVKGGMEMTVVAVVNSAIVTGFLYWADTTLPQGDTFIIAKALALQAFFSRIAGGTIIYFLKEIAEMHAAMVRAMLRMVMAGVVLGIVVVCAWLAGLPHVPAVYSFAAAYTVVNITNIIVRQQLVLRGVVRPLIILHLAEMVLVLAYCYTFSPPTMLAFIGFAILRVLRVLLMLRLY